MNTVHVLMKEPREFPGTFHYVTTQQERAYCEPGRKSPPEGDPTDTLSLDVQLPELGAIMSVVYKPLSRCYFPIAGAQDQDTST